ncbi:MAG: hypothetical protein AABX29_00445, partial [Nanoarchaeota archaeon]
VGLSIGLLLINNDATGDETILNSPILFDLSIIKYLITAKVTIENKIIVKKINFNLLGLRILF